MKTVESRNTTGTIARKTTPFFSKAGDNQFFGSNKSENPFFNRSNNGTAIQTKLNIGEPDDHYEKEADRIADRVVQQRTEQENPQTKPSGLYLQKKANRGEDKKVKEPVEEEDSSPEAKKVQRKPIFDSNAEPPDDVQKKGESSGSQTASPSVESSLNSSKGSGSPLAEGARHQMESAMGADFSGVRVHDDPGAAQMSKDLNAQAFTHGKDIYFNSGKYDTETNPGKHLLAHELTHTIQQSNGDSSLVSPMVQKKPKKTDRKDLKDAENSDLEDAADKIGSIKKIGKTKFEFHINQLKTGKYEIDPSVESMFNSLHPKPKMGRGKRKTNQGTVWESLVRNKAKEKLKTITKYKDDEASDSSTLLRLTLPKAKTGSQGMFGTFTQLVNKILVPTWDHDGETKTYQIEHSIDWQIMGKNADFPENLILLESKKNNAVGKEVEDKISKALESIAANYAKTFDGIPQKAKEIKEKYDGVVDLLDGSGPKLKTKEHYKAEAINDDDPNKTPYTKELVSIVEASIPPGHFILTTSDRNAAYILPFSAKDKEIGSFQVTVVEKNKKVDYIEFKNKDKKSVFVGKEKALKPKKVIPGEEKPSKYIIPPGSEKDVIAVMLKGLTVKGLSPIEIEEKDINIVGFDVKASGKVKSTLSFLQGIDISFSFENGDIEINAVIPADSIAKNIPRPFKVDYCNIIIGGGTGISLYIAGGLGFGIEKLGTGEVFAKYDSSLSLSGNFNFDSKYFNPAEIKIAYEKGKWAIGGNIGIEDGIIKGVKKATLKAAYKESVFSIDGDAELSIPGIDKIKLHADFAENGDFTFVADVELKKLPGIKSGSAQVTVTSKGEDGLKLGLKGEAEPDLPNVPGLSGLKLSISYLDGIFELRAKVGYKKGRFDGTIEVGVTNKQVDEKGQPAGEAQEKGDVSVFGYGQLTVDIYKDIKGTVIVRLTPEKDVLIGGRIEAKELKPFGDGFNYDKEILPFPEIEFPLAGIPGMSVSAFIKGGVHFKFVWLPLVLKDLSLDFKETNINEIEKASLEIVGSVGSSAHAEVYLSIEAGIKARVLIAKLTGSLGGQAGLGVDAEAGGKLDATWDMEKGLKFKEIRAYLDVTPKAIFRLTGQVSVDLDLWITSVNLYYHQWILAEKQLDLSGITLKLDFPIKFKETGEVELPAYESMNVVKPDFNGDSGNKILDDAINGDAKKEEQKKKEELRIKIHDDLRSADNKDVTPTEYTKKMKKKYDKSPELQEFVETTIEDESKKLEYEHFEEQKSIVRNANVPLDSKYTLLITFTMFHSYVTRADVEAFKAELARLDEEKKAREANAAMAATQPGKDNKVNDIPRPPDQDTPPEKNVNQVRKKEMADYDGSYKPGNQEENFSERLNDAKKDGTLLPQTVREEMEAKIGADFSNVKIHNDVESYDLSKEINAQAFTQGNDIFFNTGKYDTNSKQGQYLLAHELVHVLQQGGEAGIEKIHRHPVAPTLAVRKTEAEVFGAGVLPAMSLTDFKLYTNQQSDWFVESTLTAADRSDLWKLLLKTRPGSPILSGAGDLTVTDLRGVTDPQWTDLEAYSRGCDSSSHTVRITPSGTLADRIALGSTLRGVELLIPGIVLEQTVTEVQLKKIQTDSLLVPLLMYFSLFRPHLQETVGSAAGLKGGEKSETQLLLDFLKAPGMLPFISLLGRVRNLHRFAPDALTQLMANFTDFSHTKPVYLILYSGHDYNSAFIRSQSLFENLLKDKSKLVLMLEGQGSIQDIIDKVPLIAKIYGQPDAGKVNRIAEVMIAGHGSSRSVEMAGTGAPSINDRGEVLYKTESLDLDKNAAQSQKLLEILMDSMNPTTARIVYAGCLVGSTEVPVNDPKGAPLSAADIIKNVNDPSKKSLASFTRDLATTKGKGGMVIEGARASVGLKGSKSLQDAAGNLHIDYTFDPTSFGSAIGYVASGMEPEGLMRAAVEIAAVNPVVAANQLRFRQFIPAKDPWYDQITLVFVKEALDGVPPGGAVDIVKLNQLASMAPHFFLSYWASRSIGFFGKFVNAYPPIANKLYTEVLAIPAMSAPGQIETKEGRFIIELAWCMMNAARSANVIAYLDARADLTAKILEQQLDIPWLNSAGSSSNLFPPAAAASDGRLRLAIAWIKKDKANADVKAFLDSQVNAGGPRPRLQPAVIAQLTNPADEDTILMILGRLAPMIPPKGGGPALPAANADAFRTGKGPAMNDVRIEENIYTATVIAPAYVLNIRTLPSMAGEPFHWLKRGESVNVMGFVHNWAAVDIKGKLGFAYKRFLSAPPA